MSKRKKNLQNVFWWKSRSKHVRRYRSIRHSKVLISTEAPGLETSVTRVKLVTIKMNAYLPKGWLLYEKEFWHSELFVKRFPRKAFQFPCARAAHVLGHYQLGGARAPCHYSRRTTHSDAFLQNLIRCITFKTVIDLFGMHFSVIKTGHAQCRVP